MEERNLYYSLKNIPAPNKASYQLKLIEKIESLIKRMRWKAYFFLSNGDGEQTQKEMFGFKSRTYPPQCMELESFEKDLLNFIQVIEFKETKDQFQKKLKADIADIKESAEVFGFADKTSNVYKMLPENQDKLLKANVTNFYKKAPKKLESSIN